MRNASRCYCGCHNSVRAEYLEARHHGQWHAALVASHDPFVNINTPVDASDPLEAAVASGCICLGVHSITLIDAPPPYPPPTDWTPESDATGDEG